MALTDKADGKRNEIDYPLRELPTYQGQNQGREFIHKGATVVKAVTFS